MKFTDTQFAREMLAVIAGLVLLLATFAFLTLPSVLEAHPGEAMRSAATTSDWHPT